METRTQLKVYITLKNVPNSLPPRVQCYANTEKALCYFYKVFLKNAPVFKTSQPCFHILIWTHLSTNELFYKEEYCKGMLKNEHFQLKSVESYMV